ncbi:DUF5683 domain-containing protein [uncultured Porphyromonas sp.]|uniref:DUF5683 domain-containing protein n=1 Tax=uncultured Porphyromonas sp. TaxID=159274 RepID=UPI00261B19E2|nr:DUF5683 domain-containing protein [uncultured Porphyromonas sp.]
MRPIYIFLLLLLGSPLTPVWGQEALPTSLEQSRLVGAQDTTELHTPASPDFREQALKIHDQVNWQPNSSKALLWALLPGGGQIYNRKYWKLPIVWGAFMTCYYSVTWNHRQYQDYHAAYRDLSSEDPSKNTSWLAFAPAGAKAEDYKTYQSTLKSTLKRGNDFYRRYRDLSILASILVYGLSILDAYVDAELYTFDISPDLSLRVAPEVGLPKLGIPSYQLGVNCSLTF